MKEKWDRVLYSLLTVGMKKAMSDLSPHELLEIPYSEDKLNGENVFWQMQKERQLVAA